MIRKVYEVTYKESFGYAETLEQAEVLEDIFKSSYSDEYSAVNCATRKEG